KNWILTNGLDEINTAIRFTLDHTLILLHVQDKLNNQDLNQNQISELEKELTQPIARKHLPPLINEIEAKLDDELTYKSEILSINNARNCLTHDNGIVIPRCCNSVDNNSLEIHGNRFTLFYQVKGETEKVPVEFNKPGPRGAGVFLGGEKFTLTF